MTSPWAAGAGTWTRAGAGAEIAHTEDAATYVAGEAAAYVAEDATVAAGVPIGAAAGTASSPGI